MLPLELSPFFGDFFEVVLQATSAIFVTNYPTLPYLYRGDKSPRNRHEIAASLHGRFLFIFIYLLQFMAHKQRKPMDVMQKSQGPHIRA